MRKLKELIKEVENLKHNLTVVKNSAGIIALGQKLEGIKQTVEAVDDEMTWFFSRTKDWQKLKELLGIEEK